METEDYIQSNTCEIIKVDKMFVKDVERLKKEYLRIKTKIYDEIIQEIESEINLPKDEVSSDSPTSD
jgi:hypothetical protein